ncbi:MAG TPA: transposase [Phototrophicaceae bacterium]|nr:transposase [Phototrophicaceae bacterium]
MSEQSERKSIRMPGYDYRQDGVYFVTICTHQREILFGHVAGETVSLNSFGEVVQQRWNELPNHFPSAQLGSFIIMPNHVHAVVVINAYLIGARHASPLHSTASNGKRGSLGTIVGSFKSASARIINEQRDTPSAPVWQRGYHDRIVRNERELNAIREYILYNPMRWEADENNPQRSS